VDLPDFLSQAEKLISDIKDAIKDRLPVKRTPADVKRTRIKSQTHTEIAPPETRETRGQTKIKSHAGRPSKLTEDQWSTVIELSKSMSLEAAIEKSKVPITKNALLQRLQRDGIERIPRKRGPGKKRSRSTVKARHPAIVPRSEQSIEDFLRDELKPSWLIDPVNAGTDE